MASCVFCYHLWACSTDVPRPQDTLGCQSLCTEVRRQSGASVCLCCSSAIPNTQAFWDFPAPHLSVGLLGLQILTLCLSYMARTFYHWATSSALQVDFWSKITCSQVPLKSHTYYWLIKPLWLWGLWARMLQILSCLSLVSLKTIHCPPKCLI